MFTIGLTGGIASGKSTVAGFLKSKAGDLIDADEVAKTIMEPGTDVYKRLLERFGPSTLDKNGLIDRPRLGDIVFSDRESLEFLNDLTHPIIIKQIEERLTSMRADPKGPKTVILRAPLLIEVGMTGMVDTVVLVVSDENIRIERLMKYRGMTEAKAKERLCAQLPDEEKLKFADHVIENNGSKEELRLKVDDLWRRVTEMDVLRNA